MPQWVRGEAEFAVLEPWPQPMPTLALGGTVGTPDAGIEAEAVMVKDLAALAELPAGAVKDRIVFFNNPIERRRDWVEYSRAVSVRGAGPAAASALGAVGVVIRSLSTSAQRFPHTGGSRQPTDVPRIPAVAISNPDADALQRQFASGSHCAPANEEHRSRAAGNSDPPMSSVKSPAPTSAHEIVILGAHLDSWDVTVGAVDNASGVGIVLTAAHLIRAQGLKPGERCAWCCSRTRRMALRDRALTPPCAGTESSEPCAGYRSGLWRRTRVAVFDSRESGRCRCDRPDASRARTAEDRPRHQRGAR